MVTEKSGGTSGGTRWDKVEQLCKIPWVKIRSRGTSWNELEQAGTRICGSLFQFGHALKGVKEKGS
jgi:hypothetical protein